jgi:lipopolysaccharide biosynthesis glycosyltransferase
LEPRLNDCILNFCGIQRWMENMEFNVVTIVNYPYLCLLDGWVKRVRSFLNPTAIYVICADDDSWKSCEGGEFIRLKGPSSHELSISKMHHASALKLFLFDLLPQSVTQCVFLDVDIIALNLVEPSAFIPPSDELISLVPDYFVGYKEKMESEFRLFDPAFKLKFYPDGRHYYFNLGVFRASRPIQPMFKSIYKEWDNFIRRIGKPPSILEQNMVNYHLMKNDINVHELPISLNCLRSYSIVVKGGAVYYNTEPVSLFHLNGSKPREKLAFLERLNSALVKSATVKYIVTDWR